MSRVAEVQGSIEREALVKIDSEFKVEISEKAEDRDWDAFLENTPLGQFQQSGMWARAKASQGWRVARFIVRNSRGELEGGLQLLWRKKRGFRIGYISKGPVFQKDSVQLVGMSPRLIVLAAERFDIHALIVQAPDFAPQVATLFDGRPFEENILISVISANVTIDLTQGINGIRREMSRKTRQKSKQALERGVTIREGCEADLNVFFRLMSETCIRQKQKRPNPETVEQLQHIWHVFHENHHIRLSLASCEGEIVAGLLSVMFGSRITLWKKGWSGRFPERHPNELLYTESIEWAVTQGYQSCDFLSLNRTIAETLLEGRALSKEQNRSRDFFNLRFGGKPELLPESRAYVKNPFLAALYRAAVSCRRAQLRFQPCPR